MSSLLGYLDRFPFPIHRWNHCQDIWLSSPSSIVDSSLDSGSSCIADPEDFSGADLPRLPHKRYLTSFAAQQAIRNEIFGLLKGRIGHVPPLEIVGSQKSSTPLSPCYPMTLIVRVKPNNQVKARLCVRGDCMIGTQRFFMSSPTADRCLNRILL